MEIRIMEPVTHKPRSIALTSAYQNTHDFVLWIAVLGDDRFGKTSLASRLVGHPFDAKPGAMFYEMRDVELQCRGWRIKVHFLVTSTQDINFNHLEYFLNHTHGRLLCVDVSSPELEADLKKVGDVLLPGVIEHTTVACAKVNTMFAGLKCDLVPSLLHDPWEHARRLLVAIRPSVDQACAFAVLPAEIVYQIALCMPRLVYDQYLKGRKLPSLCDSGFDVASSYSRPLPSERRRALESFCDKYERPMYLASALHNVGINEMLHSIVERTLDTYGVVPNPAVTQASVVNPYCVRDFPAVVPPDDV